MKNKIWHQHLISAIFAFVLSGGAIGNLITGYDLPVDSLWKIYLWCAFFAVVTSVMLRFRYGGRVFTCFTAFMILLFWKRETTWHHLLEQVQSISYIISSHYHRVYNWPVLGTPAADYVPVPLILWGAFVAVSVNWHICRRKHIAFAIFPAVLPLFLCLLTTDMVPDAVYLYLLILAIAILLITDWTRRVHPSQGMRLVGRVTLPIALALGLVFTLNPADKYVNNAGKIQKEVVAWLQQFQDTAESVVTGSPVKSSVSEKLNLRTIGPKSRVSHSIMRVRSPIGGTVYLRGRDYDEYTGTGWEASADRTEKFTSGGPSAGELTIVTYGVRNVLYIPYYATKKQDLVGGACKNEENLQRYSYQVSRTDSGKSSKPNSNYTKLPDDTLTWAKDIVAEITDGTTSEREKIIRIQNYVRSSAVYDLSTSRMDSEYSDFAKWFLEESETGYCVHFATAATVLLRAAGIPARYVEGYMVSCAADSDVVVTNQEAHAWAEYYDLSTDTWRVLEATPDDPEDEDTEPTLMTPPTEPVSKETEEKPENPGAESSAPEAIPTIPDNSQEEVPGISTDPSENTISQDKEKEPFRLPQWIKTVFKSLLFAACVPIQAYLRIYWKQTLWNSGRPNERTMSRWRQTRSLAKLLKQPYPEDLDNLAQKAKFSQHRIQSDELRLFETYRISLLELVNEKAWYQRIILKWIFAID